MILQFDDKNSLSGARLRDPEYLTLVFGTLHSLVIQCREGRDCTPLDLEAVGCTRWEAVLVPDRGSTKELWSSKDVAVEKDTVSFDVQLLTSVAFAHVEGRARADALLLVRGYENSLQSSLRVNVQLPVVLVSNPMAEPRFDAPAAIAARNEAVEAASEIKTLAGTIEYDADRIQEYSESAKASADSAAEAAARAASSAAAAAASESLAAIYRKDAASQAAQATLEAKNTASNAKAVAEYLKLATEIRDQVVDKADSTEAASSAALAARDTAVASAATAVEKSDQALEMAAKISVDLDAASSLLASTQAIAEEMSTKLTSTNEALDASKALKDQCQELKDRMEVLKGDVIALVSLPVGHAYNVGVTESDNNVSISFSDPADTVYETGVVISRWERTRLIVKTGGYPEDENDGTVILDNVERGKYRETPFVARMGVASNYYFALFTRSTSGIWNTDDKAPRFQLTYASFASLRQMFRSGMSLANAGLAIGGVVNLPFSSRFPTARLRLLDENYRGCGFKDPVATHGLVFGVQYLLSESDTRNAIMLSFDSRENAYGITDDVAFISGKVYYILKEAEFVALAEETDWTAGENILEWGEAHSQEVYSKNNQQRVGNGYGRWRDSNIRAWLNSYGIGWWTPKNIYDREPLFTSQPNYTTGFLSGLLPEFVELLAPVYNKTERNNVPVANGGDGGGYDVTEDLVWLLSRKEGFNSGTDGLQMEYYKSVAMTDADRIRYDEGGTARETWLRSCYYAGLNTVAFVLSSGSSHVIDAGSAFAVSPVFCMV